MIVTRMSMLSGITRTRDLPITEEQAQKYYNGAMVQYAFPHLSEDDREFIISGITAEEWDALTKGDGYVE